MPTNVTSLQMSLNVAFRHYADPTTTEMERDAILAAMSKHLPSSQAETAGRLLLHRREAQKHLRALQGRATKPAA